MNHSRPFHAASQQQFSRHSKTFSSRLLTAAAVGLIFSAFITANADDNSEPKSTEKNEEAQNDDISTFKNFVVPDRSEEPSKDDMAGYVKRVVGVDAEPFLLDPHRTVFLKVYSPTCDSCKKLDFIWQVVAEELAHSLTAANSNVAGLPDVAFANMDGYKNYTRGLIDHENEGRFPHIMAFPAGPLKQEQFNKARSMANEFARFYNHRIPEHIKSQMIFESEDIPSDEPVSFTRADIPLVGSFWPMKWKQGQSMIDAMLDYILANIEAGDAASAVKRDIDVHELKTRIFSRIPEIKKQILAQADDSFLSPWDKAVQYDPCGIHIKKAMDNFYVASAGLPTAALGTLAMADYRKCLYAREPEVRKFYKEIEDHVDFLKMVIEKKEEWVEQDAKMRQEVRDRFPDLAKQFGFDKPESQEKKH